MVNFSDATVAIAITILILPLVDIANEVATHSALEVLEANVETIVGFAITFAVVGRFWLIHHRVFERVRGYTYALARVNLIWLACIVVLPFAANLLSNASDGQPLIYGIYIGTVLVTNAVMGVMEWLIVRNPELLHPDAEGQMGLFQSWITTALLVVALVLAVLVPSIGMYSLFLIFLARPAGIVRNRLRSKKPLEPILSTPTENG